MSAISLVLVYHILHTNKSDLMSVFEAPVRTLRRRRLASVTLLRDILPAMVTISESCKSGACTITKCVAVPLFLMLGTTIEMYTQQKYFGMITHLI